MNIGLYDVDSHNYPNLPLMKISAWHKQRGDSVEFVIPIKHYDKIYVSKVFSEEYTAMPNFCLQADEVVYGGTGFAITVEDGKEVYHKDRDPNLPYEIEHIYPDYSLYPDLTKNTAYGFLTRGCCNNCDFCVVSKKEGLCSTKVADLSEFWNGQKNIELLDANMLACKDRLQLLEQLTPRELGEFWGRTHCASAHTPYCWACFGACIEREGARYQPLKRPPQSYCKIWEEK